MWNGVDLELQCLAFKVGGVASYHATNNEWSWSLSIEHRFEI
jgi:hypothetical protein